VKVRQGDVKMVSDELTITLENDNKNDNPNGKPAAKPQGETTATDPPAAAAPPADDQGKVKEIVAVGNVRIDQGTRWAVGGRATYEQQPRALGLTENPVLHDRPNVVVGARVTVFLDQKPSGVQARPQRMHGVFQPQGETAHRTRKDTGRRACGAGRRPRDTMNGTGAALLRADGLTKSFSGRCVVKGVCIEVRAGEVVGLLGPNGAGKTTSFH